MYFVLALLNFGIYLLKWFIFAMRKFCVKVLITVLLITALVLRGLKCIPSIWFLLNFEKDALNVENFEGIECVNETILVLYVCAYCVYVCVCMCICAVLCKTH